MIREQRMGTPLPFGAALKPDLVVVEAGSYEKDDGIKLVLSGDNVVILGAFDGTTISLGVSIEDLLEAIQQHTRAHQS